MKLAGASTSERGIHANRARVLLPGGQKRIKRRVRGRRGQAFPRLLAQYGQDRSVLFVEAAGVASSDHAP